MLTSLPGSAVYKTVQLAANVSVPNQKSRLTEIDKLQLILSG